MGTLRDWRWVGIVILLLIGCQPAPRLQPARVRLGYIPLVDLAGLYLALDRGYFAAENLEIELTSMSGGATILPAVASGSLDIGFSNVLSAILARAGGFDVTIIAHVENEDAASRTHRLIVRRDAPIQSARDLEGKTIAVNTYNNIEHLMTQKWLERNGLDPTHVRFVELAFPEMPPALVQKQVDVLVTSEPYGTIALTQGGRTLAEPYVEIVPETAVASFVTTERWARAHPDLVRRFVRAYARGAEEAEKNPDAQRAVIPKYTRLAPELVQQIRLVTLRTFLRPDLLQWWADEALRRGLLKAPLDARVLIYETARGEP
jgi:NitT/TauT family transport system substrate-binding protein